MRSDILKSLSGVLSAISIGLALWAVTATDYLFSVGVTSALLAALAASSTIFLSRKLKLQRDKRRVFLIYAREDLEAAEKIYDLLKENGFLPWLDTRDVLPGDLWKNAVLKALERSAIALVLISANLINKKGFVNKELEAAMATLRAKDENTSPVIPVRLEKVSPPQLLSQIQWVDIFEKGGTDILLKSLKRLTD